MVSEECFKNTINEIYDSINNRKVLRQSFNDILNIGGGVFLTRIEFWNVG